MIVTEAEVVMLGNLLCVGSAICRRILTGICGARQKSQQAASGPGQQKCCIGA